MEKELVTCVRTGDSFISDGLSLLKVRFHYLDWQSYISSRCSALRISDCELRLPKKSATCTNIWRQVNIRDSSKIPLSGCSHLVQAQCPSGCHIGFAGRPWLQPQDTSYFRDVKIWNLDPQQVVSSFWEKSVTCLQPLSTLQNSILIDNQHSLTLWSFCPSNGTLSQPPSGPKSEQKKVVRSRQES